MQPFQATDYTRLNMSVLPIRVDGTKRPALLEWKHLQKSIPAQHEIDSWSAGTGLGIVCGAVSGNLEILDIDDHDWLPDFLEQLDSLGGMDIWEKLTVVRTPRPGYHLYYRCKDVTIPGNQKLAYRPPEIGEKNPKTKIETRGEGGYGIAPGSPPAVHEMNKPYELIQGTFAGIPVISGEERAILIQAARSLTRYIPPKAQEWTVKRDANPGVRGTRPGDVFSDRVSWADILKPHGWTMVKSHGSVVFWRQPEKANKGHSATTGYAGVDILFNFSSNAAPFDPNTGYTKFTAYAYLNHAGDFKAAAMDLNRQGYGVQAPRITDAEPTQEEAEIEPPDAPLPGDNSFLEYSSWNLGVRFAREWFRVAKNVNHYGWMTWKDGIWRYKADAEIKEMAKLTARRFYNDIADAPIEKQKFMERAARKLHEPAGLDRMLTMASTEKGKYKIHEEFEAFDGPEYDSMLNVLNGVVDLNTGVKYEPSSRFLITKQANVNFDPKAKCPLFDECLKYWFDGDSEMIDFFWRWVGYTMTGFTHFEHFVFLEGPGGNGKTIARETIVKMLGSYVAALPKAALMTGINDQTTNMTRVLKARMIAVTEVNKNDRLDEARTKDLVSGETQPGKLLYEDGFDFKPIGKVWMHGNHRPVITDTTESIWRRLLVVPFYKIVPDEMKDPALRYKTLLELPGILNNGIAGWQRQQDDMRFLKPVRVLNSSKDYRDEMDAVQVFLNECLAPEPHADDRVTVEHLYCVYVAWAKRNNKKILASDSFSREMTRKSYGKRKRNGRWGYEGMLLKPQFHVREEDDKDETDETEAANKEKDALALARWNDRD